MLVVRNSFIAKPGQASKLAKVLKEMAAAAKMPNARVMTDLVGDFNSVTFEFEAQSLAEFEARIQEYSSNPMFREKMAGYTDLYVTGRREVFRVVD